MGICASCLRGRNKRHAESTPLLSDHRSASYTEVPAYSAVSTKHQQDLTRIVQGTQNHLIDVTTIDQPDLDPEVEEDSPDIAKALTDVGAHWDWAATETLTADEEQQLDRVHADVVQKQGEVPDFQRKRPLVRQF